MADNELTPPNDVNAEADTASVESAETPNAPVANSLVKTQFGTMKITPIVQEMERSYLDYAMSVIVSRALPDVRDGLKPVHRRILYAMSEMGIRWNTSYKKSARIVGEVLGKFHPHGDTAVYDALVRLAQDFSMRYPLVDGQGNFGSVDGDSPAAMRYTEARLARISEELLADLDKGTVPFSDTFDGSQQEPQVLPSKLPNLLLMGAEGIAVGMATKIPPHNLVELGKAVEAIIDKSTISNLKEHTEQELEFSPAEELAGSLDSSLDVEGILEHVHGPDFPTGGIMYDWATIKEAYATGRGRVVVRAVASIEEGKNGKFQIIITQLPYQVNKAKLVAKIAHLVRDKVVTGISDLRDESDREGMRVVVDLKKDAMPKAVLNNLYKHTELQSSFPMNMVALNAEGTPQLMNVKTVLVEYLRHRQLVIIRRSQHELHTARDRAHILEGLLIALSNLDDVIETIRKSPDSDTAKARLMERFKLSERQATAILDMQLRRLAALERQKIEDEYKQIQATIAELLNILGTPKRVLDIVRKELSAVVEQYGDARRTKLHKGKIGEFSEEDLIPNEPAIVTVTETGYIKRMSPTAYRSQHRGGKGVTGMTTKEEDTVLEVISAQTHDNLLVFTTKGRVFKLKVYDLPESSRQAKGTSIVNLINLTAEERVQTILAMNEKSTAGKFIALATMNGLVKKTPLADFDNIRTNGIIAIILKDGDELVWGKITSGTDDMVLATKQGKSIRFPEKEIKSTARDTQGVRAITLTAGDYVISADILPSKDDGVTRHVLIVTEQGMGKRTNVSEYPVQKRAGQGVKVAELTTKTGPAAGIIIVDDQAEELVITTKSAQFIKLDMKNVPVLKRPTQGVILMRFTEKGDRVVAVAVTKKSGEVPAVEK